MEIAEIEDVQDGIGWDNKQEQGNCKKKGKSTATNNPIEKTYPRSTKRRSNMENWMDRKLEEFKAKWELKEVEINSDMSKQFKNYRRRMALCKKKKDKVLCTNRMRKPTTCRNPSDEIKDQSEADGIYQGEQQLTKKNAFNTEKHKVIDLDTVVLSDSSPAKRQEYQEPTEMEKHLDYMLGKHSERTPLNVFPQLEKDLYDLLILNLEKEPKKKHISKNHFVFDNDFLLQLTKPTEWVNTQHMEILMEMLGQQHSARLIRERACFVTPLFHNHVLSHQNQFESSTEKSLFQWSGRLEKIVTAKGSVWLQDIDRVYIPVILDNKHWVGLVVHLVLGSIEVLDPDVDLISDAKLQTKLSLLENALPYILIQYCSRNHPFKVHVKPFKIIRAAGLYQNKRSGDCGPVAIKFMEMHANGDAAYKNVTDLTVDEFRKQYALDIYKHYVAPLHRNA